MSVVAEYFDQISKVYASGEAREHSYRPALERLFNRLSDDVQAINEPSRSDVGAPDFIFYRDGIAVGFCEAKDIDKGLETLKGYSVEQKQRYLKGFPNLLYTNSLDFEFYREGELIRKISIGDLLMGLAAKPDNFDALEHQLRDFIAATPRTITSSKRLAEFMAGKAAIIKDVMGRALIRDLEGEGSELTAQYKAFKEHLIHDITPSDFADIYAETIAYGMFGARLHDPTLDTFSREEALTLLPKSNPFLRSLFVFIAGPDLDDRIAWIIDDLAKIFLATNLPEIMADFGRLTGQNDPFLHFYETFLAAYNPKKRKARGVWYTPEPVVNFIVRAVDEVLQTEFGLPDGLADTSKITIDWDTGQAITNADGSIRKRGGGRATEKREVHRVQILDPATGTGTFLAEVIKQIAPKVKGVAPGMWSQYIENELIPRLHGFELLMASYAMCHMKLDMILTELGYQPTKEPPRLSVWLTNSLEEGEPANQTLPFAQWLSNETKGANEIKRDKPIMCVIGNPPYLGEGGKSEGWIGGLMDDYKKEPGGKERLKERNPKWLNDLYVKFIRMSSHLIEKNGEGVLGFITNHGYLDNPTFRGMRWHLLKTFDKIWVLDLHGNAKKKEVAPDGSPDKNVFDIQQGVAIIIAVKRGTAGKDKPLAEVYHGELWGTRERKYTSLLTQQRDDALFKRISPKVHRFALIRQNNALEDIYNNGISLNYFMPLHGNGIVTKRDGMNIQNSAAGVNKIVSDIISLPEEEFRSKYQLPNDVRDWRYEWAKADALANSVEIPTVKIGYRIFDDRYLFYSGRARGMVGWPVQQIMRHYLVGKNYGLLTSKAHRDALFAHTFITNKPTEAIHFSATTGSNAMNFPLYLYPEEDSLDQTRRVNFEPKLYKRILELAAHPEHGTPDEVAVFDYIYGVLHSPDYRETFAEFLKIDFPRIPWPKSPDVFWHVREKGEQLRRLHLMEPAVIGETPYPFEGTGDNVVGKPQFDAVEDGTGTIWINKDQGFRGVPKIAWNFYIGGYQPAQKWLKDRKGRTLSYADVQHYQRIIKILSETDRIMKEIELPIDGAGEGDE